MGSCLGVNIHLYSFPSTFVLLSIGRMDDVTVPFGRSCIFLINRTLLLLLLQIYVLISSLN